MFIHSIVMKILIKYRINEVVNDVILTHDDNITPYVIRLVDFIILCNGFEVT